VSSPVLSLLAHQQHFSTHISSACLLRRLRLKYDGTRAETRFRLSAKRTSPFKSVGGRQFSRLLAAEVCASAVLMLDTPCSEVVWRVLATHCNRQFPLHFPSRASPCAIFIRRHIDNMKLLLICISYSLGSIFINVHMVVFLFNTVIYVSSLLCLCVLIVCLCIFVVPAGTLRLPWLRFFHAFSSVVRKMPG